MWRAPVQEEPPDLDRDVALDEPGRSLGSAWTFVQACVRTCAACVARADGKLSAEAVRLACRQQSP